MQQESPFSFQLKKYISMAIKIWPSLRVGMRHISDITGPQQNSLLPKHSYHTMTQDQFLNTIINDMHQFIMQHDVKEEDIEDYLNDVLDLLNIDEDLSMGSGVKMGSVRYMSRELVKVIEELQEGKTETVDKFEANIYLPVLQMGVGEAIRQGEDSGEDDGDSEGEDQMDEESDESDWSEENQMQQQQNQQKNQQKTPENQEQKKKQQELEDDGWVIVKKKK